MSENEKTTTTYEIFGLLHGQADTLTEKFGSAVHEATDDSVTLELSDGDAHNLTHEGYFMRRTTFKPQ